MYVICKYDLQIFFSLVIPRLKVSALFDFVSITEVARSYTDIREEISKQFEFVNVRKRRLSCRVITFPL